MQNLKYILSLSFLCLTVLLAAQTDLETGEIDVIKDFDVRLLESERINVDPRLPPVDTSTTRQDYNILKRTLSVEYLPPKIRPLAMKKAGDNQEAYPGYVRIGAGFPTAFYGEVGYNVLTDNNFKWGFYGLHHSANNNGNVENQKYGFNNIDLDGTYYGEQGYAVNANLNFTSDNVFFYGYNGLNEEQELDISLDATDVKQQFSTFNGKASIFNGERTVADFNYLAGVDFYFLEDEFAARERGFLLTVEGEKWINEEHPFKVTLITDFTNYRDTASQNLNNFFLKPNFTYHGLNFMAKIGVNIASHEDEFSFFPDLELSANLVESILGLYVGATGDLYKNSFRNISDYNPYVISRIQVENTRYFRYYGGVKGNIEGIDYDIQVSYEEADDVALYVLDNPEDTLQRFAVLYDTVNTFKIMGAITAPLFEDFELTATVSQNFYSPQNELKAWHLPALTVNVNARYKTLEDKKLTLIGEMFVQNGVPYRFSETQSANLNGLFDVSVGAEYQFTDNFGGFVNLNNLLNNKRERWRRYPTFGINALVGLTARF